MAKKAPDLMDTLRARGLRRRVAKDVAAALDRGRGGSKATTEEVGRVVADLRRLASELEDRASGRSASRKQAAEKAARTRARNARKRSESAKKAAQTRAKRS
jgi:hypothetical protein